MIAPVGSQMVIINADNSVERKDLQRADIIHGGKEEVEGNPVKLRIELQKWQNNGFQLKGFTSASINNYIVTTTAVLTKN